MAGRFHFGACLACRCLQVPEGEGGDYVMNQRVRDLQTLIVKKTQQAPGAQRSFLSVKMEDSHMIQKANAWLAVDQWLTKTYADVFTDAQIRLGSLTKDDRRSAMDNYSAQWARPEPLIFPALDDWVKTLKPPVLSDSSYLTQEHIYACCKECNHLMDVEGYTFHLLWNILRNPKAEPINARDEDNDGEDRLIPRRAVSISFKGSTFGIPRKSPPEVKLERLHYYTAALSYYIHRCIRGLKLIPGRRNDNRAKIRIRLYVLIPVLVLKLLCLKKEFDQRWSEDVKQQRSTHNYAGVIMLYISYAVYMMYLCDSGSPHDKIIFQAFHLFYMSELVYMPRWDRGAFRDLWHFVLRDNELSNGMSSTQRQVQNVVKRLVELYKLHVHKLLLVIHPNNVIFKRRCNAADITAITDQWIPYFVDEAEATQLFQRHTAANSLFNSKQFSLYVMQVGIAPIVYGIRRLFTHDGVLSTTEIDKWISQCMRDEYKRMQTATNLTPKAVRTLYHMCFVARVLLERGANAILQPGQNRRDVMNTAAAVNACVQRLAAQPLCSVWKAALVLPEYSNLLTDLTEHDVKLPNAEKDGLPTQILTSTWRHSFLHPLLRECFSMRSGLSLVPGWVGLQ